MAPLMADKGLAFETDVEPGLSAWMDPVRFGQVVTNLLDDALKDPPSGGTVRLAAGQSDDRIRVEVADDGLGVAKEAAGSVFDAFVQIHEGAQQPQACTGLGLSIAQGIAQQHQGTIGVDSPGPGQGSTFSFELAVEPPRTEVDARPDLQGRGVPPARRGSASGP